MIQNADAIILPQTCSLALYKACTESKAHVFPDYELRFKYPGKVGQSSFFEKLEIPYPATKRWPSVKRFRDYLEAKNRPPHAMPFFIKADKSHEGEGVYFVDSRSNFEDLFDSLMNPSPLMGEGKGGEGKPFVDQSLETALARFEEAGSGGFISQELISCGGNVLRAVVLHKRIITYWKRADPSHGVISTVSHGARVDKKWRPGLQERGKAQAQWICENTGINLAAFDFAFNLDHPDPQPFILEINYYFGRRGLGGSFRYYRLLLKAIQEWLKEKGFDARPVKLV